MIMSDVYKYSNQAFRIKGYFRSLVLNLELPPDSLVHTLSKVANVVLV